MQIFSKTCIYVKKIAPMFNLRSQLNMDANYINH